eukprot:2390509-Pyramimonas_sp.AAC.1
MEIALLGGPAAAAAMAPALQWSSLIWLAASQPLRAPAPLARLIHNGGPGPGARGRDLDRK